MQLDSMKPPAGSRRPRKRLGRGTGSGLGKTSGRGHKGQGARSGGPPGAGFEGGQMPMARRLPKRGFNNPSRVTYQVVNLKDLERFEEGATVDVEALRNAGLARKRTPVKVLGGGSLARRLTVRAHAFSRTAAAAIGAAGGQAEVIAAAAAAE